MENLHEMLWGFVQASGYPALFALLTVEEAGIPLPLPGDLVIMWAGYQYSLGHMDPFGVIGVSTAAVALGSTSLYTVSRRIGHTLIRRYGRRLRITPERMEYAERKLHDHGFWAIAIGRLIPGLRNPMSLAAGTLRLPYYVFLPATMLAALVWTVFYFVAGVLLGQAYDQVEELLFAAVDASPVPFVAAGVIAAAALGFWALRRFTSRPRAAG